MGATDATRGKTDRFVLVVRRALEILDALVEAALDFAAPPRCAACGVNDPHDGPFCAACTRASRAALHCASVSGFPLWAAGSYAPPLSDAIRRFKYEARPDLARPLGRLAVPALSMLAPFAGEVLVPVPLHPQRLAERGYNQAALLAAQLARASGLRCRPRALRRLRHTPPQVGRSRADRMASAAGLYEAREGPARGCRVILVDDVATTGATLSSCIRALLAAGAHIRGAVLLARAAEAEFDR
jgi:ComF family protein